MTLPKCGTEEWENLCDKCGRCCLIKYGTDPANTNYTRIACFMLDVDTMKCKDYLNRRKRLPTCQTLTHTFLPEWLPYTCAYKRAEKGLPPLSPSDIDAAFPKSRIVSEKTLRSYKFEDYFLCKNKKL